MDNAPTQDGPDSLTELLRVLRPTSDQDRVFVQDMLDRIGGRSFAAVILVPAVLLVSPLSGIPGMPTLNALLIILIAAQAVFGRDHLWLPGALTRRSIGADRLSKALDWLARPAGWMDRFSKRRLRLLSAGPARTLSYLAVIAMAVSWPPLELLPFFTSFGAGAVAMVMFGIMTRDGAYILAGYIQGTGLYLLLLAAWSGLF